MNNAQIADRLEKVERDLEKMKAQMQGSLPKTPTGDELFGMFRNDAIFKDVVKIGAAYRQSLRPRAKRPSRRKK